MDNDKIQEALDQIEQAVEEKKVSPEEANQMLDQLGVVADVDTDTTDSD